MVALIVIAVLEIILLCGALVFLLHIRRLMRPVESWWSFVVRDVLWILLAIGNLAVVLSYNLLTDEVVMCIQFIIILLFIFSIRLRYRMHVEYQQKLQRAQPTIDQLESLRRWD